MLLFFSYIGDCRVQAACESFVHEVGPEIVRRNLTRNLMLHLVNLADFGLIRPQAVYRVAIQYFRLRSRLDVEDSTPDDDAASSPVPGPSRETSVEQQEPASDVQSTCENAVGVKNDPSAVAETAAVDSAQIETLPSSSSSWW